MMVTNNNRRYVLLLFTGLLFIMATVSPLVALAEEKPTEKDFAKFRQTDTAEIEAKFAALAQKTPDAAHIVAVQAAAEDIETIAAKAMEAMDGVRARVVSDLMSNALGTGAEAKKPRVIPITHADEVRNLYTKHYAVIRKAVAATEGKSGEAVLARQYLDAMLAAAQNYIITHAGELNIICENFDLVAAEWATLMPLLRTEEAQWNKELITSMPEWMQQMSSLRASEYICLATGRSQAAYQIWRYQISADDVPNVDVDNYLANLTRRSNAYLGSKDFLKGLAVIKAIIILADAENKIDEAVKTRFRLAEVYVMYGHSQLAADEMKMVVTNYPNHKECGHAAMMRIKLLYQSKLFEKVLDEVPAILEDKAIADCHPQILYMAWITNRQQGKHEAAKDVQNRFIRDYPLSPLCADMYFASAMNSHTDGDHDEAIRLLEMITEKYPNTSVAATCRQTLSRIQKIQKQTFAPSDSD